MSAIATATSTAVDAAIPTISVSGAVATAAPRAAAPRRAFDGWLPKVDAMLEASSG